MGLTGTKPLEGCLSVGQAHQRIIHQDTLDIQNTLGCTTEYTWVHHRIHLGAAQNTLGCTTEYTWVHHRIHIKDQELV